MARVAVALAFALILQGAFAAPSCGCDSYPVPLPTPCDGGLYGPGYPGYYGADLVAPALPYAYGSELAAPAVYGDLAYAGAAPYAYDSAFVAAQNSYYPGANLVAPASYSAPVPVGPAKPEGFPVAGPSTAYSTGPVCKTSTFEVPVKSATSAKSGPVAESTAVVEGYCSTSCAATRAKCGGTTKNVSFKTPTIINKGSRTSSTISPIGNAVTTRSTQAGKPEVSSYSRPAGSFGPVPVPAGPAIDYPAAPAYAPAYGPAPVYGPALPALYDAPALYGAPALYDGAVYGAPALYDGVYPGAYPGAYPGVYPGAYPVPTATFNSPYTGANCACACSA